MTTELQVQDIQTGKIQLDNGLIMDFSNLDNRQANMVVTSIMMGQMNQLEEKAMETSKSYEDIIAYQKKQAKIQSELEFKIKDMKNEQELFLEKMEVFKAKMLDEISLSPQEAEKLQRSVKARAYQTLKVKQYKDYFKETTDQKALRKVVARIWSNYKKEFGVSTYKETKRSSFEDAMHYVESWKPVLFL